MQDAEPPWWWKTGGQHRAGQRRMSRDTDAAKGRLKRRRTLKPASSFDAERSQRRKGSLRDGQRQGASQFGYIRTACI